MYKKWRDLFSLSHTYNAKKILQINKPKKVLFVGLKTQYSERIQDIKISNLTVDCSLSFPMTPSEQRSRYASKTRKILEVKLSWKVSVPLAWFKGTDSNAGYCTALSAKAFGLKDLRGCGLWKHRCSGREGRAPSMLLIVLCLQRGCCRATQSVHMHMWKSVMKTYPPWALPVIGPVGEPAVTK